MTTETAASDEGVAANAAWYPRESMDRESRATPRIPDSTAEDTTTRLTETRSAQSVSYTHLTLPTIYSV